MRSTLNRENYLIYLSRTLPVRKNMLMFFFLMKEFIYYSITVLIPVIVGLWLASSTVTFGSVFSAVLLFFAGLASASIIVAVSRQVSFPGFLDYQSIRLYPVTSKSLLDVKRSSGGIFKVIFSLVVVTGFYWFFVEYVPLANTFLTNPLLSFATMLGIINITFYNWLNLFDSFEDYIYLPYSFEQVLYQKQQAFLAISIPFVFLIITSLYILIGGFYLASIFTGLTVTMLALASVSKVGGLNPNEALMETSGLLKIIGFNLPFIVPLMIISITYPEGIILFLGINLAALAVSYIYLRTAD